MNNPDVPAKANKRFNRKNLALIVIVIAAVAYGVNWLMHRIGHVRETDARITSSMIVVSGTLPGRLTEFALSSGDSVNQGDILAVLDRRQSELKLAELDNQLKTVEAQLAGLGTQKAMIDVQTSSHQDNVSSRLDVAVADAKSAETSEKQAYDDWQRAEALWAQKMVAQRVRDQAQTRYLQAVDKTRASNAEVAAARAALAEAAAGRQQVELIEQEIKIQRHKLEAVELQRQQQQQDWQDRAITSPINAVVDKTFVNRGEFVSPGQRLMLIHDPANLWVEANIKETSIKRLELGQRVDIHVDAYPNLEVVGTVINIGSASTSQFALIPTPNPSGNFIKITQRLPVKIEINQPDPRLKPGMMVEVDIVVTDD